MRATAAMEGLQNGYRSAAGEEGAHGLPDEDRAVIVAAMKDVARAGLGAAKHLRGDVYEVKADTADKFFRVLFAPEGRYGQVLLALDVFAEKTRKTPPGKPELAERRLRDWRRRGSL